jgi:tetratricopeptide (TPR) repeat protein
VTLNVLGAVYLNRGYAAQAIPLFERALEISRRLGIPDPLIWATALRGAAQTLVGPASDAVASIEQALEMAASTQVVAGSALWRAWLAEAYLGDDRVVEARQMAVIALDLAVTCRDRGQQAWSMRLLGEIAVRETQPDLNEAEVRYREALALAEELGMRPLQAHCHLGLGKLYRRVERIEEAQQELAVAVAMLREMGMTFWLPEAEAELTVVSDRP